MRVEKVWDIIQQIFKNVELQFPITSTTHCIATETGGDFKAIRNYLDKLDIDYEYAILPNLYLIELKH